MRKSRFTEEQIPRTVAGRQRQKRVYRLYCQEGLQLRMKVKRMRIALATRQASGTHRSEPAFEHWIFSTTSARRTSISILTVIDQ